MGFIVISSCENQCRRYLKIIFGQTYHTVSSLANFKCRSCFGFFLGLLAFFFARATSTDVWQAFLAWVSEKLW